MKLGKTPAHNQEIRFSAHQFRLLENTPWKAHEEVFRGKLVSIFFYPQLDALQLFED